MQFLHHNFHDAIHSAVSNRTYGVYFSEEQNFEPELHMHDCCEVFLALSDDGAFFIDGKKYDVNIGDLFVINQFEPHKFTSKRGGSFSRFALYIHPEYLLLNSTDATDLSHCFFAQGENISNKVSLENDELAPLQQLLMTFRKDNGFGDDILKSSAINTFLMLVNKYFIKNSKEHFSPVCESPVVANTISYINEHFSEQLTLETLAKDSFVSVNQLCKIFKNSFGTTIAKYITAKRISEAKKLLSKGSNVADTAKLCGFSDYANFIRVFKKSTGISPGKYGRL